MPYKVFEQDDEYCVYKVDDSGNRTGSSLGCHKSRSDANDQITAINISEHEDKESDMEKTETRAVGKETENREIGAFPRGVKIDGKDVGTEAENETKELYADGWTGEVYDTDEYVPWGVTSFEEYDASVEAKKMASQVKKDAKVFDRIVDNILDDDRIESPGSAIMKVASEFASRIGIKKTKEVDAEPIGESNIESGIKSYDRPFMVYKDVDGTVRFLTTYSNNRRDMDNPPEIISAASHERFEKMVDSGEAEYPELWLWHTPTLKIGKTDFIAYDKDNGIAMAAGYFFKEAEFVAEAIADNPDFWGVSHGMPAATVKRSKEDPTVIVEHITKEISPLPFQAAANKWADFTVLKEVNMTLSDNKKAQLVKLGVTGEALAEIEEKNKSLNENLNALDIESKETSEEDVMANEKEATENVEQKQEPEAEAAAEVKETEGEEVAFSKEQTEQLKDAFAEIVDRFTKQIDERLKPIEEALSEKKSVEEVAEDIMKDTPTMSLVDQIFPPNILKQQSATNSEQTVIDGRTKLAQDGPAETKEAKPTIVKTGSEFMDTVITNIFEPQVQE